MNMILNGSLFQHPLVTQGRGPGEVWIEGVGYVDVVAWDDYIMYDTVQMAPTSGVTLQGGRNFVFFRDIAGKDNRQTNMSLQSQLPTGWEFIVFQVGIRIPATATRADANGLLHYGYGKFVLDNTFDAKDGPLTTFPPGYGTWGTANIAHAAAPAESSLYQNGLASKAGVGMLDIPLYITHNRTFRGDITFYRDVTLSDAEVTVDVCMFLWGLIKIPAQ